MRAFIDDISSIFFPAPRVAAMQSLARQENWDFSARQRLDQTSEIVQHFSLLKGKRDKRLLSVIRPASKVVKGQFRIYDYVYFGDSGKKMTTVLEYHNSALDLPAFSIRPKGVFQTFKEVFIASDVLFESVVTFNKHYQIRSDDREQLADELNEDFLDMLGMESGWSYEGHGDFLIAYQPNKQLAAYHLAAYFSHFERCCERLINGINSNAFV
jgi:hypothetical protein